MKKSLAMLSVLAVAAFLPPAAPRLFASDGSATAPPAPATTPDAPIERISPGEAAVLGVIEGLTEYLPVSSTGHLILASHAMGLTRFTDDRGPFGRKLEQAPAVGAFEIVIQLGAILAVLSLYRRRAKQMCLGLVGRDRAGLRLVGLLLVAFLPAAVVGLLLRGPIKQYLFSPVPVVGALIVGGVLMVVVEWFWRRRYAGRRRVTDLDHVTFRQALVIGCVQCLAMWPGTSRSMVTILAGLVVGLDMVVAAEFSFLLALPTLGGATVYEAMSSWSVLGEAVGPAGMAIGLAVSWVVAALSVKALVKWLTGHGLWPFGVYRVLAGVALYAYFAQA